MIVVWSSPEKFKLTFLARVLNVFIFYTFLFLTFLADRINGHAIDTVLRPSLVCRLRLSVVCTECIVAKRCVPEQKLLLRAYRKAYVKNRLAWF